MLLSSMQAWLLWRKEGGPALHSFCSYSAAPAWLWKNFTDLAVLGGTVGKKTSGWCVIVSRAPSFTTFKPAFSRDPAWALAARPRRALCEVPIAFVPRCSGSPLLCIQGHRPEEIQAQVEDGADVLQVRRSAELG